MTITNLKKHTAKKNWSIEQSRLLYRVKNWSEGYFDINESGHVIALPGSDPAATIDLHQLTQELKDKNYPLPILLRFTDILQHRVNTLCQAFDKAKKRYKYNANYTAVYPVKVNQQRHVIEDIIQSNSGRIGLETGSKPELLSIIGLAEKDSIVICNGYKDKEYIRLALIGQQLGLRIYIVIDKLSELNHIIQSASEMHIKPRLGIRVRLSSVASGNWQNTGGEKSKFGLNSMQVLEAIQRLKAADLLNCLELLHFHIGSQISNIVHFQHALHEGARFYAELRNMNAPINTVDVGGGLGVDYEGTQSNSYTSVNYTMHSYAKTVVHAFSKICREQILPHPAIISESGRAITAHHAILITNVIDIEKAPGLQNPEPAQAGEPQVIQELWNILQFVNKKNARQSYFDAKHYYVEAKEKFAHGLITLHQRARIEELYFSVCQKTHTLLDNDQHEIINELNENLADKYFCNFSLFQSMPDSWAINQIFPIMPLHRLDEQPSRRTTIQDLTCDSDGRIDLYVENEGIINSLPAHHPEGDSPYLIGIFLLGAYQEILGDMHNLFGDTASINVEMKPNGGYCLTEYHPGDTVSDLLEYVHIDPDKLKAVYIQKIASAGLSDNEQKQYLDELTTGLTGYTYLEE